MNSMDELLYCTHKIYNKKPKDKSHKNVDKNVDNVDNLKKSLKNR